MNSQRNSNKKGTALLMTVLVLSSIFLVSFGVASIVFNGVKMGIKQLDSTQAYFAAEAGAEAVLWEFRKGCCVGSASDCDACENSSGILDPGFYIDPFSFVPWDFPTSAFMAVYKSGSNVIFVSTGYMNDQWRTIELDLNMGP